MRPIRKKRLQITTAIVVGLSLTVALMLFALRENINLFYTPSQIANGEAPFDQELRAGGLVVEGSVERGAKGLYVEFDVSDTAAKVRVVYDGILPDLFREGQGIIAIGKLKSDGKVHARQVLAKHDENYMPPEVKDAIEAVGHPQDAEY